MQAAKDHSEITYVLFGKEAIKLYNVSPKTLLNSTGVDFWVGAYSSVKKFVSDSKKWDDFIEISKDEFLEFRKSATLIHNSKPKKKGFFSKFFK